MRAPAYVLSLASGASSKRYVLFTQWKKDVLHVSSVLGNNQQMSSFVGAFSCAKHAVVAVLSCGVCCLILSKRSGLTGPEISMCGGIGFNFLTN